MKGNGYRMARCCGNCEHLDARVFGRSGVGHFCTFNQSRCTKTKVCNYYTINEEKITKQTK